MPGFPGYSAGGALGFLGRLAAGRGSADPEGRGLEESEYVALPTC
jgi:hypothetical protein